MPGQDVVEVLAGRSGDRAAEQVGEHQDEHHRRDRHVEQLLGDVLDLEHPAPAEGERGRQRARARRARGRGERLADGGLVGGGVGSRCAVGSVLMLPAPRSAIASAVCVLGRVAGQREEHLVEARLAEREVGDPHARPASSATASAAAVGVGARRRQRRRDRARGARRRARARGRARPRGRCSGSSSRTCSAPEPTDALSWPGVPSAITRPWSITAIPSASWSASSRYWVQSRIVVPSATSARTMSQTWLRERGSSPVVGSSRNISSRRDDDARGDVEPAPHAARVVLDQPAGRLGEAERLEQLGARAPWPRRASARAGGRAG